MCPSHRRQIKRDVGTQYEAEIGIVAIESYNGEITNHTTDKQNIDVDEIQTTNENVKDENQLSKIAATKKMTSLCQSRRTGREDIHQTTADSLNTNFVSTRQGSRIAFDTETGSFIPRLSRLGVEEEVWDLFQLVLDQAMGNRE